MRIELTEEMKKDFKNASYGVLNYTNKVGCSMVTIYDKDNKEIGVGFYNLNKEVEKCIYYMKAIMVN